MYRLQALADSVKSHMSGLPAEELLFRQKNIIIVGKIGVGRLVYHVAK